MGKLFGTDGVRGVAGKDLTCELALQIGRGTAAVLTSLDGHRPKILIGKDTRVSGDMLESTLAAGLCSVGADVELLGRAGDVAAPGNGRKIFQIFEVHADSSLLRVFAGSSVPQTMHAGYSFYEKNEFQEL